MQSWKYLVRTTISAGVLLLAGCGLVAITDSAIEPQEPLSSATVVITPWAKGSGFLVDRGERLLVTAASLLHEDNRNGVEVIFPAFDDDKVKVRRDYYFNEAPRIKGTVIASSPKHDLAVLRLESVPDDAVELKLAATGAQSGEQVRLVGAVPIRSQIWGPAGTTVRGVASQKLTYPNNQIVSAKLMELESPATLGKNTHGSPIVNDAGEVVGVVSGGAGTPPQLVGVDGSEVHYFLGTVYRYLASVALSQRNYAHAVALCDKSLAIQPNDPLAYNERGAALSFLDRYDDAIAAYSQALKLDTKLARAYRNRGSAYFYKGAFQQAVDDCSQAIKLDPKYVKAYETRGQVYTKLRRTAEARADEEQVRELNKINWKANSTFPDNWFPLAPPPSPGGC